MTITPNKYSCNVGDYCASDYDCKKHLVCKYANELPCVNVVLNIFRSDKYYNDVTNNNNYGSADQVKFYTIPPSKLRVNGINNPSLSTSWLVGENGVEHFCHLA